MVVLYACIYCWTCCIHFNLRDCTNLEPCASVACVTTIINSPDLPSACIYNFTFILVAIYTCTGYIVTKHTTYQGK